MRSTMMKVTLIALAFFLVSTLVGMGVGTMLKHASYASEVGAIEQLRADFCDQLGNMSEWENDGSVERIFAQITAANQTIRKNQIRNHQWWFAIQTPNGWDKVHIISDSPYGCGLTDDPN
jgi:hypothetical protein